MKLNELDKLKAKREAYKLNKVLYVDSLTGEVINPEFDIIDKRGFLRTTIKQSREDKIINSNERLFFSGEKVVLSTLTG